MRTLFLGMPGAGKTTTLINLLEKELTYISPQKIAYVSFTKKAILEAQNRVLTKLNISKKEMPFFKTLHALAFGALGLSVDDVVNDEHLKIIGNKIGADLLNKDNLFQPLSLYNLSRVKNESFFETWRKTFTIHTKTFDELQHAIHVYCRFKKKEFLLDFTDMILQFNQKGAALPVKTVFVDEAQDLSTIQWMMIDKAFSNADKIIFAGDDDQCIYSWSGADRKKFLNFNGKKIVLKTSYRCPTVVANFANKISNRIISRYQKSLTGTSEVGKIAHMTNVLDCHNLLKNGEEWLILLRNRSHICKIKKELIFKGVSFTIDGKNYTPHKHFTAINDYSKLLNGGLIAGENAKNLSECAGFSGVYFNDTSKYCFKDIFKTSEIKPSFKDALQAIYLNRRQFYADVLKTNQSLEHPRVHITTIHGAKGAECQNVILSCDQSKLTYKAAYRAPGNEHRVFYVGVTRSKKNLYLLAATKKQCYLMPDFEGGHVK